MAKTTDLIEALVHHSEVLEIVIKSLTSEIRQVNSDNTKIKNSITQLVKDINEKANTTKHYTNILKWVAIVVIVVVAIFFTSVSWSTQNPVMLREINSEKCFEVAAESNQPLL